MVLNVLDTHVTSATILTMCPVSLLWVFSWPCPSQGTRAQSDAPNGSLVPGTCLSLCPAAGPRDSGILRPDGSEACLGTWQRILSPLGSPGPGDLMMAFVLWDRTRTHREQRGMGVHRLSLVPGSAHIRGSLNDWFLSGGAACVKLKGQAKAGGGGFKRAGDTYGQKMVWSGADGS